jgi:glucose/arabinose dehydrogenase
MPSADKGARYASILADFPACIVFSRFSVCCARCGKGRGVAKQARSPLVAGIFTRQQWPAGDLTWRAAQALAGGKGLSDPIIGVPKVWASGQGGLLDVVLAPDFAQSRRVWLSYAEVGHDGKAGTAVGYGRLSDDVSRIEGFQVVFRQMPKLSTGNHFGGRLVFDGKGYLFIGLAKTTSARPRRNWTSYRGKWCV